MLNLVPVTNHRAVGSSGHVLNYQPATASWIFLIVVHASQQPVKRTILFPSPVRRCPQVAHQRERPGERYSMSSPTHSHIRERDGEEVRAKANAAFATWPTGGKRVCVDAQTHPSHRRYKGAGATGLPARKFPTGAQAIRQVRKTDNPSTTTRPRRKPQCTGRRRRRNINCVGQ